MALYNHKNPQHGGRHGEAQVNDKADTRRTTPLMLTIEVGRGLGPFYPVGEESQVDLERRNGNKQHDAEYCLNSFVQLVLLSKANEINAP